MSRNGRHISIAASNRLQSLPTWGTRPAHRSESAPGYDVVIISVTEQACAQFATAAAESIANKGGKLEPKGRTMTIRGGGNSEDQGSEGRSGGTGGTGKNRDRLNTGARKRTSVLFIFMDLGQRVSTLTWGGDELKPLRVVRDCLSYFVAVSRITITQNICRGLNKEDSSCWSENVFYKDHKVEEIRRVPWVWFTQRSISELFNHSKKFLFIEKQPGILVAAVFKQRTTRKKMSLMPQMWIGPHSQKEISIVSFSKRILVL